MDRVKYNDCMKPFISGHHEDRKMSFCVGAKVCSGKAGSEKDAEKLCLEAPPAPRKTGKRGIDPRAVAACVIENLETDQLTVESLAKLLAGCIGKKLPSPNAEKRKFIKNCVMENTVKGNFVESVRLGAACEKQWRIEND